MYAFGSLIDVVMNWSSGCPALAADSFRLSRSGPTLPFDAAGLNVWHAAHGVNSALPAAAFPAGCVWAGVVPVAASAFPFVSRPKTTTALSIAAKNATETSRYTLRQRPGKFGFRRGRTNDETRAKTMKSAPVVASPI